MKSIPAPGKNRKLKYSIFFLNLLMLLAVIWIVVPAQSYYLWLFSVLASEWSLGFGIAALFGMFCAVFLSFKNGRRFWIISFFFGATAFVISLYPFFSAYQTGRTLNSPLSLRNYFAGFWKSDSSFDFTTRTFANVNGNDLKLDIYQPPDGVKKNGAGIVVIHGGSWSGGNRNDFPQWNRWLSENGFTIFDVDYRLAQPNWQTATGDVKCAAGWVQQNAAEFNISPDKIVLMGRSAGAHLALLAAYSGNNEKLPASCSNEPQKNIRAVISFYAPTDLIWDFDNPANQKVIDGPAAINRLMGGNPNDSEEMKNNYLTASPVKYITPDTPPTLLIHGGHDQLVLPQNMNFIDEKLKENNVRHQTIFLPYAQHGFDYNFFGWGSQIIKPQILEFLNEMTK